MRPTSSAGGEAQAPPGPPAAARRRRRNQDQDRPFAYLQARRCSEGIISKQQAARGRGSSAGRAPRAKTAPPAAPPAAQPLPLLRRQRQRQWLRPSPVCRLRHRAPQLSPLRAAVPPSGQPPQPRGSGTVRTGRPTSVPPRSCGEQRRQRRRRGPQRRQHHRRPWLPAGCRRAPPVRSSRAPPPRMIVPQTGPRPVYKAPPPRRRRRRQRSGATASGARTSSARPANFPASASGRAHQRVRRCVRASAVPCIPRGSRRRDASAGSRPRSSASAAADAQAGQPSGRSVAASRTALCSARGERRPDEGLRAAAAA